MTESTARSSSLANSFFQDKGEDMTDKRRELFDNVVKLCSRVFPETETGYRERIVENIAALKLDKGEKDAYFFLLDIAVMIACRREIEFFIESKKGCGIKIPSKSMTEMLQKAWDIYDKEYPDIDIMEMVNEMFNNL